MMANLAVVHHPRYVALPRVHILFSLCHKVSQEDQVLKFKAGGRVLLDSDTYYFKWIRDTHHRLCIMLSTLRFPRSTHLIQPLSHLFLEDQVLKQAVDFLLVALQMTGTILLTGGTGKTAIPLANKLQSHNILVLLASRKAQFAGPVGFKTVRFDWFDEATYANPFDKDKNIDTVYIIIPPAIPGFDTIALVKKFIDLAMQRGVERFLLMSGAGVDKGAEFTPHGQIHAYLDTIGVDYAVLRPSRFFGAGFVLFESETNT